MYIYVSVLVWTHIYVSGGVLCQVIRISLKLFKPIIPNGKPKPTTTRYEYKTEKSL